MVLRAMALCFRRPLFFVAGCPLAGAVFLGALAACTPPDTPEPHRPSPSSATVQSSAAAATPAKDVIVSVVGTNDLHGRVLALPLLAGYVEVLRKERQKAGGDVLLVDAGDMFQGTLESNLLEGTPVRDAYARLGYAAVAVGNHEFDFGPAGPFATPHGPEDDRRGALKSLAKGAPFPFLIANVFDKATGKRVDWPNMPASTTVVVAGIRIGVIGVTAADTLDTTISSNVDDLTIEPLSQAIEREASALRASGARAVIALAHAGGKCKRFTEDVEHDECEGSSEIFELARTLPKGALDAIVAGHTHAGLAHEINGVPIIEQHFYGRSFGRIDLTFSRAGSGDAVLKQHRLFAPRDLCANQAKDPTTCDPGSYEGVAVTRSADVQAAIAAGVEKAKERRDTVLGPELSVPIKRSYDAESALGNLFAQMLLDDTRGADVAMMNGGGLRQDLPAGTLRYASLFEAFPFDNRVASARIKVADLKRLLIEHLRQSSGGILSLAGIHLRASCEGTDLKLTLFRQKGSQNSNKPLRDEDTITLVASDFMLLGGDGFWGPVAKPKLDMADTLLRDVFEKGLGKLKTIDPSAYYNPKLPRFDALRPMKCPRP